MKKLITLFALLSLLTVFTAGQALAAQLPAALNGTDWVWHGFAMNSTGTGKNATVYITPKGYAINSAYGTAQLNGSVFVNYVNNGADMSKQITFFNGTNAHNEQLWTAGSTDDETLPGLIKLSDWNATESATYGLPQTASPFYFVPASGYSVLVGISNSTQYNATLNTSGGNGTGISLVAMYKGTAPTTSELTGTWYFYTVGVNASSGQAGFTRMGSIDFTNSKATFDNDATTVTANTITSSVVEGGAVVRSATYGVLLQNATFDSTKKVLIGSNRNATTGEKSFTVAVKDGSLGSASDFKSASYKMVTAGSNSTGAGSGILASIALDSNGKATAGNATIYRTGSSQNWPNNLASFTKAPAGGAVTSTVAYATTTVAGVSQANATFKTDGTSYGSMIGRFNADKTFMVGIFTTPTTTAAEITGLNHIGFFFPSQATVGDIAEDTKYNNATVIANLNVSSTNATALSTSLQTGFGLSTASYKALTDMRGFNASINNTADNGATFVFKYTLTDLSVSDISTLRFMKLVVGTSSNSSQAFTYKPTAATTPADGHWWIEDNTGTYLASGSSLVATTNYTLYFAVKDQTSTAGFDRNTAGGSIYDPTGLFAFSGSSSSSSGDSTGCVFNPAANFGLEWLLLLIAPVAAFFRNRFRK